MEGIRLLTSIAETGGISSFRLLDRSYFAGEDELDMFRFIDRHYRRHGSMPTVETIEEELGFEVEDAPEPTSYYLEQVYNRKMYNELEGPFRDLRDALINQDTETARSLISDMYSRSRVTNAVRDLLSIGEVGDDVLAMFDRNKLSPGLTGIPTGWGTLDETTGGWQDGDLIAWVARMKTGKTWLLTHQAKAAWMAGFSVLFVSMEMPLWQIGNRFYSSYAGVNPDLLRKGRLCHWAERRFRGAVAELDGSNRFHLFAGNMGKSSEDIDILIQELNPDIILIDGMYLMKTKTGNSRAGRYEVIANVTDILKQMAIVRNRPIVATTQFGRGAGKKGVKGDMESIGYTDTIGTHSSVVVSVKVPVEEIDLPLPPHRELEIIAGREGETWHKAINFKLCPYDFSTCELASVGSDAPDARRVQEQNLDWME